MAGYDVVSVYGPRSAPVKLVAEQRGRRGTLIREVYCGLAEPFLVTERIFSAENPALQVSPREEYWLESGRLLRWVTDDGLDPTVHAPSDLRTYGDVVTAETTRLLDAVRVHAR